ncbi:DUF805 domain-containing protein [Zhongshania sp.]|uniref:DUF805 domain-containing protein n=1 Tax=Zhongshania sp. TaxID=1971902 RepID=UPI003564E086
MNKGLMMEYFTDAFKKYAEFSGRASRQAYWMFVLVYFLIYVAISVADYVLNTAWLAPLFSLVVLLPSISITARRLHDTGRSGWWQLIYLVPLIGLIVMLVFLCQASGGDNEYDSVNAS